MRIAPRGRTRPFSFAPVPIGFLGSQRRSDANHSQRYQSRRAILVIAYRALEEWELLGTIQAWLGAQRRRPKRGTEVTIIAVLDART
jgi:hypothetical protein